MRLRTGLLLWFIFLWILRYQDVPWNYLLKLVRTLAALFNIDRFIWGFPCKINLIRHQFYSGLTRYACHVNFSVEIHNLWHFTYLRILNRQAFALYFRVGLGYFLGFSSLRYIGHHKVIIESFCLISLKYFCRLILFRLWYLTLGGDTCEIGLLDWRVKTMPEVSKLKFIWDTVVFIAIVSFIWWFCQLYEFGQILLFQIYSFNLICLRSSNCMPL